MIHGFQLLKNGLESFLDFALCMTLKRINFHEVKLLQQSKAIWVIKFPKFGLEKVTRSHVISYVARLPALKMKLTKKWVIILLVTAFRKPCKSSFELCRKHIQNLSFTVFWIRLWPVRIRVTHVHKLKERPSILIG